MRNKPRLLIVEDNGPARERYSRILRTPRENWTQGSGLVGFEVDSVATVQEARKLHETAILAGKPYEVILLDLRLPATLQDLKRGLINDEHGLNLLKEITSKPSTAVVVLTGHPEKENLIGALRFGASDFLIKPLTNREAEKMLFIRLAKAVGVTREVAHRELSLNRLARQKELDNREAHLVLSREMIEMAGTITQEIDEVEGILSLRYGLDLQSDADNPISKNLAGIRKTCDEIVSVTEERLSSKQVTLLEQIEVERILELEAIRVQPCYLHRDVELVINTDKNLQTKTSESELREMFSELLFGVLDASSEKSIVEISARAAEDGRDILVSASLSGEPVPGEIMETLNKGQPLSEVLRERWRSIVLLWSLSRNVGIRIQIERKDGRNSITLLIPVISNE